jgi:hypothetical protein
VAEVDVARVVVRRAGAARRRWRAISYGANGEKIAITQTYRDVRDAQAAGYTISAGAPVTRKD